MPKGNTKRSFGQLSPSELGHNAKFPHTAQEPDLCGITCGRQGH